MRAQYNANIRRFDELEADLARFWKAKMGDRWPSRSYWKLRTELIEALMAYPPTVQLKDDQIFEKLLKAADIQGGDRTVKERL